jgi:SAM-dependent methyltransferase
MGLIGRLHESKVHGSRVESLRGHLLGLLPHQGTVLDVGCGDGLLSSLLASDLPNTQFRGMDVLVREDTKIQVAPFDGVTIPLENKSVDTVMMIDVLHHTENPSVLMREATRVARKTIVLKDHTKTGFLAGATLRFMDWVGNAKHGVALPYNYLTRRQWDQLFDETGVAVDQWIGRPRLYGRPGDWLFGRRLQFLARLTV